MKLFSQHAVLNKKNKNKKTALIYNAVPVWQP